MKGAAQEKQRAGLVNVPARAGVPWFAALAREFHEAYERLAPSFGYETRKESAVPWEDVLEANRDLMAATVKEVIGPLHARLSELEGAIRSTQDTLLHKVPRTEAVTLQLEVNRAALRAAHSQKEPQQ